MLARISRTSVSGTPGFSSAMVSSAAKNARSPSSTSGVPDARSSGKAFFDVAAGAGFLVVAFFFTGAVAGFLVVAFFFSGALAAFLVGAFFLAGALAAFLVAAFFLSGALAAFFVLAFFRAAFRLARCFDIAAC